MTFRVAYSFEFLVAYHEVNVIVPSNERVDNRWPDGPDEIKPVDPRDKLDVKRGVLKCAVKVCQLLASQRIPVVCFLPREWVAEASSIAPDATMFMEGIQPILVWNAALLRAVDNMDLPRHCWFVGSSMNKYLRDGMGSYIPASTPKPGTPETHYIWFPITVNTPAVIDKGEDSGRLNPISGILSLLRNNLKIWLNADMSSKVLIFPENPDDIAFCSRLAVLALLTESSVLFAMSHPQRRYRTDCQPNSIASVSTHQSVYTAHRDRILVPAAFNGVDNQRILTELELSSGEMSRNGTALVSNAVLIESAVKDLLCRPNILTLRNGLKVFDADGQPPVNHFCALDGHTGNSFDLRHPEAAFDEQYITFWVELGHALSKICCLPRNECEEVFAKAFKMAVCQDKPGLRAWLELLGLSGWAPYCERRIASYQTSLHSLDAAGILLPDVEEEIEYL